MQVSGVLLRYSRCLAGMATARSEPWRQGGLVRGVGVPAPSGRFAVGCVDLMHHLDGDEEGGLLVRLFYPTASPSDGAETREMQRRYPYAKWLPSRRYVKGYSDYSAGQPGSGSRGSGILTELIGMVLNPKIPARYGAPVAAVASPVANGGGAGLETTADSNPELNGDAVASSTDDDNRDEVVRSKMEPTNQEAGLVSDAGVTFSAVVFSHGLGAMRTTYSSVCCDIASHGYVVASVEHRDRSACVSHRRVPRVGGASGERQPYNDEWLPFYHKTDSEKEFPLRNGQVRQRANDVKRSLDLLGLLNEGERIENMMDGDFDFSQFKGRIDVGTAAVVGHSFGGATTIQTLSEDPRFSCGIALDCWMVPIHHDLYEVGLQRPLLFINSFDFQWVENVQRMMKLSRAPDENGMSMCRVLTLRDTNHMSQSDVVFVIPNFVMRWGKYHPARDPKESFSLNMDVCHSFLKRHHLRDPDYLRPVPNLDGLDGHSEYLIFGTNVDLGVAKGEGGGAEEELGEGGGQDVTEEEAGRGEEESKSGEDRENGVGEVGNSAKL